jgi:transposase-like protein
MDDYHLTRSDFELGTTIAFKSLISDKGFADVTLACADDKQITAHKVILAASSPFFNNILLKNPHQHPLLYLKGINSVDLEAIIKFIYTGETSLTHASLDTFLAAAQELQVHGLLVDLDVKSLNKTTIHEATDELTGNVEEEHKITQIETLEETTQLKQIEVDEQKYKCQECDFVSSYNYNLRRHRVKVHNTPAKPLTNTNTNMSKLGLILQNSLSPANSPMSKFKCQKCEFLTENSKTLRRHMQNLHEKYLVKHTDEKGQLCKTEPNHSIGQWDA